MNGRKHFFSFVTSFNRKRHDAIKISFDETNFEKTCPEVKEGEKWREMCWDCLLKLCCCAVI